MMLEEQQNKVFLQMGLLVVTVLTQQARVVHTMEQVKI